MTASLYFSNEDVRGVSQGTPTCSNGLLQSLHPLQVGICKLSERLHPRLHLLSVECIFPLQAPSVHATKTQNAQNCHSVPHCADGFPRFLRVCFATGAHTHTNLILPTDIYTLNRVRGILSSARSALPARAGLVPVRRDFCAWAL